MAHIEPRTKNGLDNFQSAGNYDREDPRKRVVAKPKSNYRSRKIKVKCEYGVYERDKQ